MRAFDGDKSLQLYRASAGSFAVVHKGITFHADNVEQAVGVLRGIGIDWKQIEEGIVSLEVNGHHYADYGIGGRFIFSRALDDVAAS